MLLQVERISSAHRIKRDERSVADEYIAQYLFVVYRRITVKGFFQYIKLRLCTQPVIHIYLTEYVIINIATERSREIKLLIAQVVVPRNDQFRNGVSYIMFVVVDQIGAGARNDLAILVGN